MSKYFDVSACLLLKRHGSIQSIHTIRKGEQSPFSFVKQDVPLEYSFIVWIERRSFDLRIAVVNCDKRMQEVYFHLSHDYETIAIHAFTDFDRFNGADALVLPVKGLTDSGSLMVKGKEIRLPASFWQKMKDKPIFAGIPQDFLHDFAHVCYYMEDASIKAQNAVYTAEGVLYLLIDHTGACIKDLQVDVIGYGLCGREIVTWLRDLHIPVRIVRRPCGGEENCISVEQYRNATCGDVIINTSIAKVIDRHMLETWEKKPLIIDIATPDVIDSDAALRCGVRLIKAGNLPAQVAYESAGQLIAEYVRGKLNW